jgi:hypothetical protein
MPREQFKNSDGNRKKYLIWAAVVPLIFEFWLTIVTFQLGADSVRQEIKLKDHGVESYGIVFGHRIAGRLKNTDYYIDYYYTPLNKDGIAQRRIESRGHLVLKDDYEYFHLGSRVLIRYDPDNVSI